MLVKEVKNLIRDFVRNRVGALEQVLGSLHLPPSNRHEQDMEAYKTMYRLFSRFIDLASENPVRSLMPTHEILCRNTDDFLNNLKLPESMNVNDTRLEGADGLAFYALFHIFGFFINYRDMKGNFSYYPMLPMEEMNIREFKNLLRNFVEPKERAYKLTWTLNIENPPGKVKYTEACHMYLLRLYHLALYEYLGKEQPDEEPSLETIREETKNLISWISWADFHRFENIVTSDKKGAALVAMYEIILSFYSLPKPEPPGIIQNILNGLGVK